MEQTVEIQSIYSEDVLRTISSLDDALKVAGNGWFDIDGAGYEISSQVLGNGFDVIPTAAKADYVGVPFFILEWRFNPATKGGEEFVSLLAVTQDGQKVILNDGGTGIMRQLKALESSRRKLRPHMTPENVYRTNLMVARGLRVSEYDYEDEKGRVSRAETYYLN